MVYIPYMTVLYMVYNPQQTCEAGGPRETKVFGGVETAKV